MARKLAVMHFKQSQNVAHFLIFELVYKRYKMIMEVMYSSQNLDTKPFAKLETVEKVEDLAKTTYYLIT